jgi:hypothetical protein
MHGPPISVPAALAVLEVEEVVGRRVEAADRARLRDERDADLVARRAGGRRGGGEEGEEKGHGAAMPRSR